MQEPTPEQITEKIAEYTLRMDVHLMSHQCLDPCTRKTCGVHQELREKLFAWLERLWQGGSNGKSNNPQHL